MTVSRAIRFLSIQVIIIALISCAEKPSQPEYDNPFDPENTVLGNDPFKLRLEIAEGGVKLQWQNPGSANLDGFTLWRSVQKEAEYTRIADLGKNVYQYVDLDVQNGHTYYYYISAVNTLGRRTDLSATVSLTIHMDPVISINGGDAYTTNPNVQLTLLAANASGMLIAEDISFNGASWQAYSNVINWQLSESNGERYLYVKIRYEDGKESVPVYDHILLDTHAPVIRVSSSPDSGASRETFFTVDPTATSDNLSGDQELRMRVDIGNDGTYEAGWVSVEPFQHRFDEGGGLKEIELQVRDGVGLVADTVLTVFVNTRPEASFKTERDPENLLRFHFDASGSSDFEDGNNLSYRWDFDGDGTWDTAYGPDPSADFTFTEYTLYVPVLSVRDQDGLTAQTSRNIWAKLVEMVYVKGGAFQMGDPTGMGDTDEVPVHTVNLNDFYIGKFEITQAEYFDVMGENPSAFSGADRPVESISWYDAVRFCNTLSEDEGLQTCYIINGDDTFCNFSATGYRLPTEAEWEFAARAGENYIFSGSDSLHEVGWYNENAGSETWDAGMLFPNGLDVYDMSGNVWEWCWDWYGAYETGEVTDPRGPSTGTTRILRGGSWLSTRESARNSNRRSDTPDKERSYYGFRVARTAG